MRPLAIFAVLAVTACSASPASLGITGPSPPKPPPTTDDSTILNPGIPDPGNSYGPGVGPSPTSGRYYNYN